MSEPVMRMINAHCRQGCILRILAHGTSNQRRNLTAVLYDTEAPKRSANLSVNADLLRQAKSRKINLSRLLEQRLIEVLKETEREAWREQNKSAIEEYNARIERQGAFSDGLRRF